MDEKKICSVTAVNDVEKYQKCKVAIKQLVVPEGYQVEAKIIMGSSSMRHAYNEAISQTDAKYKIYLHQDVLIID